MELAKTIFIIGAGAIGKVLAVMLQHAGRDVVLLRGSVDGSAAYSEKIQVLYGQDQALEAEITISCISNFRELDGLVVLTNKSYGNSQLSEKLKDKLNASPLVILQNGLGVEQFFADEHFPEVYRCVLFVTSQVLPDGKVRFKPVDTSPVGLIKGSAGNLNRIVELLGTPGFPFRAESDIQPVIWKKAIINCVFNSVCPLLDIDNGIFHRSEKALDIAGNVIMECITIAREKGVLLEYEEVKATLLQISRSSSGQLISTLQDIRNGRRTEIETLNFEVVSIAKTLHRENAVMQTQLLGELTKLKSELIKSPH